MMVVVLLYRADLPRTITARPWSIRIQGLPKPLEELQLLPISEHHLTPGGTLELEDEFGFLTP